MVRAVRGATTINCNTAVEIISETSTLLKEIIKENSIDMDEIISVFFTVTRDINAEFPAVAARKLGWTNIALLCTNEIDVPGSMEKCIRVMLHFNSDKKNSELKHIYRNEARKLRPDLSDNG
ncbi:MAG: chorismate mutase [Ruminiclostridium sp.]|nr:chorismate mutase [Ruminiclostridium sp.]